MVPACCSHGGMEGANAHQSPCTQAPPHSHSRLAAFKAPANHTREPPTKVVLLRIAGLFCDHGAIEEKRRKLRTAYLGTYSYRLGLILFGCASYSMQIIIFFLVFNIMTLNADGDLLPQMRLGHQQRPGQSPANLSRVGTFRRWYAEQGGR
jgi:hypothetical protein